MKRAPDPAGPQSDLLGASEALEDQVSVKRKAGRLLGPRQLSKKSSLPVQKKWKEKEKNEMKEQD